jgi:HEAT repeat protein
VPVDQSYSDECRQLARAVLASSRAKAWARVRAAFGSRSDDTRSLAVVLATLFAVTGTPEAGRSALLRITGGDPGRVVALSRLDPVILFELIVEQIGDAGEDDIDDLIDELVARMRDSTAIVRQRAAIGFGLLADFERRELDPLLRIAAEDADGEAVAGAILGLWATGDVGGIDVVHDAARRDPDWRVRLAAATVLLALGDPNSLRDVDHRVVTGLISAFPSPLSANATQQLLRLVRDHTADWESRRAAAIRLAASGEPDLASVAEQFGTRNAERPEMAGFAEELAARGASAVEETQR